MLYGNRDGIFMEFTFSYLCMWMSFLLLAANKGKDRRFSDSGLQKTFTEKVFITIHTLLNAYFNPLFQIILVTIEKACIVLLQYIASCKNQILFTAEPDFLFRQSFSQKNLYMSLLMTLQPCPAAPKT